MTAPTSPRPVCPDCRVGNHCDGEHVTATGRQVPDTDPYRDRDRLLPEFVTCGCGECGSKP